MSSALHPCSLPTLVFTRSRLLNFNPFLGFRHQQLSAPTPLDGTDIGQSVERPPAGGANYVSWRQPKRFLETEPRFIKTVVVCGAKR